MIKIVDTIHCKLPKMEGVIASLAVNKGTLVAHDFANAKLVAVTGSVGTTLTLAGVVQKTSVSGDTVLEYTPLDAGIYCEVDCTNNTAANQLHQRHAMTDSGAIANTDTDIATTLGVFFALKAVGAASDKKLYGYFIKAGQVTA